MSKLFLTHCLFVFNFLHFFKWIHSLSKKCRWHFTAFAGPPTPVLIVTPQASRAIEIALALAPFEKGDSETNVFQPTVVTAGKLTPALIEKSHVIWLQDIPALPDATWNLISKHVEQGHGLVVTLGDTKIDSVQ